ARPSAWTSERVEKAGDERRRRGRAAGDQDVDGHDFMHAADDGVRAAKDATVTRAVSGSDDEFRIGRGVPRAPQGLGHVTCHRTGDQGAVGVARGGHEVHAESLEIIVGTREATDLELAAVARAGVDLTNGERAAEARANRVA